MSPSRPGTVFDIGGADEGELVLVGNCQVDSGIRLLRKRINGTNDLAWTET